MRGVGFFLVGLMLLGPAGLSFADAPVSTVINLEFHSSFWVNLHHTLFAAAWAQRPETGARRLVRPLPAPLTGQLSQEERAAWDAAVAYYDRELADQDLRTGRGMTPIKQSLAAENLSADAIGPDLRAVLERAAPVYRRHSIVRRRPLVARIQSRIARSCAGQKSETSWSTMNGCMGGHGSRRRCEWTSCGVGRAYTTLNPTRSPLRRDTRPDCSTGPGASIDNQWRTAGRRTSAVRSHVFRRSNGSWLR